MPTSAILVGNTDNKLSQQYWADFVQQVDEEVVSPYASVVHFSGGPQTASQYQNWCWVIEHHADYHGPIWNNLDRIAREYENVVAFLSGETEFINARN